MNTFLAIAKDEIKQTLSWFYNQTFSKLAVAAAFIFLFVILEVGIYRVSRQYFFILASSREYIQLTAQYILRSMVLILLWVGIGSSVAATLSSFYASSKKNSYLLTLPLSISNLVSWQFLKKTLGNMLLLSILLLPVSAAYSRAFGGGVGLYFYTRFGLGLFLLSALTVALGGTIAYVLALKFTQQRLRNYLLGVFLFGFILVQMFKFVFPSSLAKMARATPQEFDRIYLSLPLSSPAVPSNWITEIFSNGHPAYWLLAFIFTLPVVALSLSYQSKKHLQVFLLVNSRPMLTQSSSKKTILSSLDFSSYSATRSLITKDLLSLLRQKSELGYAAFILVLSFLFLGLLSQARLDQDMPPSWVLSLKIFAFLGLIFFTNTFLLRMAFPSMAREGESLWYLFSLPLHRAKVWYAKVAYTILLSLPFLLISLYIWPGLSFAKEYSTLLALLSFLALLSTTLIQAMLGLINPNYSESSNPDKISTSFMGLLTLTITLLLSLFSSYALFGYLSQSPDGDNLLSLAVFVSCSVPILLAYISKTKFSPKTT